MVTARELDGLRNEGIILLHNEGNEYRIGRPYVVKDNGIYKMFFAKGQKKLPIEWLMLNQRMV